jgi:hypothetical protein
MSRGPGAWLSRLSGLTTAINSIFYYDPQLIFTDTFERIHEQLIAVEDLLLAVNPDQPNYWIVYDIVLSMLPIAERLIFCSYADQILEFLLSLHHSLSSNLMFCTSRFIPLRLQLFTTICSAMANTEASRDKDAEQFIHSFKTEIVQLKQLEEANVNGLSESIVTCRNEKVTLSDLFQSAFAAIELMSCHFTVCEELAFDKVGSAAKGKRRPARPQKEDSVPASVSPPPQRIVELIINSFNSPIPKSDYVARFAPVLQAWCGPDCQLGPALFHRLLYALAKTGPFEGADSLVASHPADPIVRLASALSAERWADVSDVLSGLSASDLAVDFQFFCQVALKVWHRFCADSITDASVLGGVLHVLVESPGPCPLQLSIIALRYCWHLDSVGDHRQAADSASAALDVIERFRDVFETRKLSKILPACDRIPSKPVDQGFRLYERWLECLHTDLFSLWVRSTLRHGLAVELEAARARFAQEIEDTKRKCARTKDLYGSLSTKQRTAFDTLLGRQFKPPTHSEATERQLLDQFRSNNAAKAVIHTQMSFFRPAHAAAILERARFCLAELDASALPSNSPLVYTNRSEMAFVFHLTMPEAKKVAMYGKETVGSSGLTPSNTALAGTGIRQEPVEPFVITKLKANTLYSFAFGAFDNRGEMIDSLTEPFTVATVHSMSVELIWSYVASAAYQLKDLTTFDISLTFLLNRFTNICDVPHDKAFHPYLNPFNRFLLKETALSEPAPMLRAFAVALVMAARLFEKQPIHAGSFQRLALLISQVLTNSELTLIICNEMYATLYSLLANAYHTEWIIHPLLYIVQALRTNTETSNQSLHQELLAKTAFSLDLALSTLYQERQLSLLVVNSVLELPPNPTRSAFIFFAARQQLLEVSQGDQTLPILAANLFRANPERSFDELFAKFKQDPQFPTAAVYLVYAAHHTNAHGLGLSWAGQTLEYVRGLLRDSERQVKQAKNWAASKLQKQKKKPPGKGSGKSQTKQPPEDENEVAAATKIHATWNKYQTRRRNIAKFDTMNRIRAPLNLLQAMCTMENESPPAVASAETETKIARERRHAQKARAAKHKDAKKQPGEEEAAVADLPVGVMTLLRRAIVLGTRIEDRMVVHAAAAVLRVFLSSIVFESPAFAALAPIINQVVLVLIGKLPLDELWARELLHELLVFQFKAQQIGNLTENLDLACKTNRECGKSLWLLSNVPQSLVAVQQSLERRDPAENIYYSADSILQKVSGEVAQFFKDDPVCSDTQTLVKAVSERAISLQHKQRLSMSISLMTRLSFAMFRRNEMAIAVTKLREALEGHFRVVHAHLKVEQIMAEQTEETFYQKHSWAGCLSISVISSLLAMHSEPAAAMFLAKLGAFALASIFTSTNSHPKKQIDYADYEPPELLPGLDIFSSFDSAQPLMKPIPAEFLSIAFSYLLSAMLSFELYFEMFKPCAIARHFFRYIVRDRHLLARTRLMSVLACCHFGFIRPAVKVLGDVLTNFGHSRMTNEYPLYPSSVRRPSFDTSEPASASTNLECLRSLTSSVNIGLVTTNYGFAIACQFAICVSRILQAVASCSDPTGSPVDPSLTRSGQSPSVRGRHRPKHHSRKEVDSAPATQSNDVYELVLRLAEVLLNDFMNKEFKLEQNALKFEIQLEQSLIKTHQWRWEDALKDATSVLKADPIQPAIFVPTQERSLLIPYGLVTTANSVITAASYNLNDFQTTEKFASPYYRALLLIHKADMEGAGRLLAQVAIHPPITEFHLEYVLSVAQLVALFCFEDKLVESCLSKLGTADRGKLRPLALIQSINNRTMTFFIKQLALNDGRSYFIRNVELLVRLKHLEAVANGLFHGDKNPILLLNEAQSLMTQKCPFVPHGLSFRLNASASQIQMQSFLTKSPGLIQFWNKEINPLQGRVAFSPDTVEQMSALLLAMFGQAPDCVVHPGSEQSVLDLALLCGVMATEPAKRVEQSFATLSVAAAVRSARRFVQSLIASSPDQPASSCPMLLLNENKDQKLRGIAASYYSHVCSLGLPFFDTRILELRTLFFFKCFEEQCASFKALQKSTEPVVAEPGQVVGQWYKIDGSVFKGRIESGPADGATTTRSTKTLSTSKTASTRATTASGATRTAALLRGTLYFFLGIVADADEAKKKALKTSGSQSDSGKVSPIIVAAQHNDLQTLSDEMAEIGLQLNEANRMENAETGEVTQQKDQGDTARGRGRRSVRGGKGADQAGGNSLLKGQAQSALKNAQIHWHLSIHKAETIFNKSNRIIGLLAGQRNRWPSEVKMSAIEMTAATTLSHFFNPQYGINEKAPQLAEWLYANYGSPANP